MNDHDFELLLTRLIDGDLSVEERAQVEARLPADAAAKRLYEQHLNLTAALREEPVAISGINWDSLSSAISANLDTEEVEDERSDRELAVLFSFKWLRPAMGLAVAACALIAVGIGIWRFNARANPAATSPVQVAAFITHDTLAGQPSEEIQIGPSAAFSSANMDLSVQEAIVAPPTRVAIDSAVLPAQDSDRLPY